MDSKPQKQVQTVRPSDQRLYSFASAGLASCVAVTFSNVFEVVKTRLQLQGELMKSDPKTPKVYKSVSQAFWTILKNEGPMALEKGLGCAYLYQIMLNGLRVGLYEPIKYNVARTLGQPTDSSNPNLAIGLVSGSISGVLGAAAGSPFYLVKTRLQSSSNFAAIGHQHHYTGIVNAFKTIYSQGGIKGLYQGVSAACLRVGVGSPVQLVSYDYCKNYFGKLFGEPGAPDNSLKTHFASGMVSSFFLVLAMNPFDVISTRMYNQKKDPITHKGLLYNSLMDCIVKTAKAEKISGFYKGLFAHYLRIGPHTILMFICFEQIKSYINKKF
ncbi:hypothetical protein BB561_003635 [Smittium simulii]|uniref:Uncharacterized protein n=1 Tax=Smittium simulii TaxID=133385 RepID=A0A2T9Y9W9_9FUNG|nr:hypothetical protein BB561_005535 [Smittium simulii]PVU92752.1 hypothetical protein BB561_003635 [Smittium simulii]